jgi:hypothetical protein
MAVSESVVDAAVFEQLWGKLVGQACACFFVDDTIQPKSHPIPKFMKLSKKKLLSHVSAQICPLSIAFLLLSFPW